MKDRALVVPKAHDYKLHPKVEASLSAAAERWGADYLPMDIEDNDHSWNYRKMLFVPRLAGQYEQIVFVDGDVLIRSDCPWPEVPLDHIGWAPEYQPHKHDRVFYNSPKCVQWWGPSKPLPEGWWMPNTGFNVVSPDRHGALYEEAFGRGVAAGCPKWPSGQDQGIIACLRYDYDVPVTQLPVTYNFQVLPSRGKWKNPEEHDRVYGTRAMLHWVYHLSGGKWSSPGGGTRLRDKVSRIMRFDWELE